MSPSSDLHRLGNIDTALTKRKHKHIIKRSWKKKKKFTKRRLGQKHCQKQIKGVEDLKIL